MNLRSFQELRKTTCMSAPADSYRLRPMKQGDEASCDNLEPDFLEKKSNHLEEKTKTKQKKTQDGLNLNTPALVQ